MIKLNINVTRIPRERIKPGKNGKYIDLVLFENRDGPDKYGNNGFVSMDVTKEEREAGTRGVIIGNWKDTDKRAPRQSKPASAPDLDEEAPF